MIRSVRIRGFKRFRELHLPGHAVLTGPNDIGKTTLLQAIASWALALRRWQDLGDFKRRHLRVSGAVGRSRSSCATMRAGR